MNLRLIRIHIHTNTEIICWISENGTYFVIDIPKHTFPCTHALKTHCNHMLYAYSFQNKTTCRFMLTLVFDDLSSTYKQTSTQWHLAIVKPSGRVSFVKIMFAACLTFLSLYWIANHGAYVMYKLNKRSNKYTENSTITYVTEKSN